MTDMSFLFAGRHIMFTLPRPGLQRGHRRVGHLDGVTRHEFHVPLGATAFDQDIGDWARSTASHGWTDSSKEPHRPSTRDMFGRFTASNMLGCSPARGL